MSDNSEQVSLISTEEGRETVGLSVERGGSVVLHCRGFGPKSKKCALVLKIFAVVWAHLPHRQALAYRGLRNKPSDEESRCHALSFGCIWCFVRYAKTSGGWLHARHALVRNSHNTATKPQT